MHAPAPSEPALNERPSPGDHSLPLLSEADSPPEYGPVRRVTGKTRPNPGLIRPLDMNPETFVEMMSEMVPRMIEGQLPQKEVSSSANPLAAAADSSRVSPREGGHKRDASQEPEEAREAARARVHSTEALFCTEVLQVEPLHCSHVEQLMASFLQKRAQKEIPPQNNPPELQGRVDEAKTLEWETVSGKNAVRVWKGQQAADIRARHPDRFIGSRFVITNKCDEDGERIKARWCLQGHHDPDFDAKIRSGECHSPTLSQLSRSLLLQVLVSRKWTMHLGDIKGAFLEAGPIPDKYRPLFAHQPPGGIPGLDPNDVVEILGNLYGANDAPSQWYREFDAQARAAGFTKSMFDPCLYYFRDSSSSAVSGVLGAHVDDTITGGEGEQYQAAIAKLRARFPYRKWRTGTGEFCGTMYNQDPRTFEITFHQETYAKHLRPISLTKERQRQRESTESSQRCGQLDLLPDSSRPVCTDLVFAAILPDTQSERPVVC